MIYPKIQIVINERKFIKSINFTPTHLFTKIIKITVIINTNINSINSLLSTRYFILIL